MSVFALASAALPQHLPSPSSPAAEGDRAGAPIGNLPQSPSSPGSMAVSFQRYETPHPNPYTPYAEATPQLTSSETSPSTAAMSAQTSQQAMASTTNTFPTPASSVGGYPASLTRPNATDDEGDIQMKMGGNEMTGIVGSPADGLEGFSGDGAQEHRRTNHDRQGDVPERRPAKRAGGADDIESEARVKRRRSRDDRAIFERLHADVGPLYLLCSTPHPVSRPRPTQDLLSLYGLQPLAATVARTDPVTGEKRKIRKTYKGKIQAFGLAGRNQEVKHPEGQPGGLVEMMQWPEEEWQNQKVMGKEVENGLSESTLAKLERALKMQPGPLPGFDAGILGLDAPAATTVDPRKAAQAAGNANKPAIKPTTGQTANASTTVDATAGGAGAGTGSEMARPKRAGKKRRYDERSFEGYEEGFMDDDLDDDNVTGGASTSDRDERRGSAGMKKRKKNPDQYAGGGAANSTAAGLMERGGGSYGVGMVGIGSGLGAYGGR